MSRLVEVRRGAYQDSVSLMLISQELAQRSDVSSALVAMATELNLSLLVDMGFAPPADVSPNDMLVALDAADDDALDAAVAALDEALARRPAQSGLAAGAAAQAPTVAAAARQGPADLVLVSTPGRVAVLDAVDALNAGLDVMVFSDNVPVSQEVALKRLATERDCLVMGPDCGTAVVGGVGLGFANVVRPGPVGIVAASGTGAQHLLALLDDADIGVSHCLGVGGRDLSTDVGGLSTKTALRRLAADRSVELIVVLSKPPAESVAADITDFATTLGKQVVMGTLGPGQPDLTETAARVAGELGITWQPRRRWGSATPPARSGFLRGLFSGGTLCDEAMLIASETLGTVSSNIPLAGQPALDASLSATGHTFIDFGDDRLTVGRPHPMIDGTLRIERLRRELGDPSCAAVLLDVVLGHGSHPDPATELAPVIATASKAVIVSLVGTRDDPQGRDGQAERLVEAGAIVHASNAAATREAVAVIEAAS
jgi:FdrA protein